jgi:hypothetical protein
MSSVPFVIPTTQSVAAVIAGKSTTPPTATAQPQSNADSGSVTISPAAMSRSNFEQGMSERLSGRNQQRAMYANDPSNPLWAKTADQMAHHTFNADTDLLYDISGTVPGGDGILRYSSGEPATAESRVYATQQGNRYQSTLLELYNSEMAKNTPPGDLLIKMQDLQEQQPARFRAMAMWPVAADFASNQTSATTGSVKSS